MRDILFRGKTYSGEWVQGTYYHQKEFYGDKTDIHYIIESCDQLEDNMMFFSVVIPETVGQYTGLTDKNDKKIFEGDIIKWGLKPCVVKWDECNASFCLYTYGTIKISGFNRDTMKLKEVIGNIHDNPELLERSVNND